MRVQRFVQLMVGSAVLHLVLQGCSSPSADDDPMEQRADSGGATTAPEADSGENSAPEDESDSTALPDAGDPTDDTMPVAEADGGADSTSPNEDGGITDESEPTVDGSTSDDTTPSDDTTNSGESMTSEEPSTTDTSGTTGGTQTTTVIDSVIVAEADGQEVTIDLPDEIDPTTIVVFLTPIDEPDDKHPVPSEVQDGQVIVQADEPGTYQPEVITPPEVEDCNEGTWDGSITVSGNVDVDRLEGVTRIQGNLTISDMVTDLSALRCLTEITGNLDIGSASELTVANIPNLTNIRGRLYVYSDPQLTSIELPNLQLVNTVTLQTLTELTEISIPRLISSKGSFALTTLGATADDSLAVDLGWLVSIPGALSINGAANLETLDGFEALQEVDGEVDVRSNATLTDATGLARIESVGGGITIYNNAALSSVALSALTALGGAGTYSLNIQALPELTSLDIGAIEETPGVVYLYQLGSTATDPLEVNLSSLRIIRNNLSIQGVTNLVDLDGLSALQQVTGSIDIRTNEQLESALGLAALQSVTSNIVIYNNEALQTISLASLESLGDASGTSLNIQALPELVSLDVSALLEVPGGIYLYQLGSTAGGELDVAFDALEIIRGNLDVQQVVNITSLDAFSGLTEVTGTIDVRTNEILASATGFATLETVGGRIVMYNNPELTEISLASLTEVGELSSESLNIQTLPELVSLDVGSLVETPSQIYLYDLGSAANGDLALDFASLEIVRSSLTFSNIDNIATVDAFAALEEIGGNLVVDANLDLVSLSGFDALTTLEGSLYVRNNPLLSECLPLELRNRLEDAGFDGTASISGNLADTCD